MSLVAVTVRVLFHAQTTFDVNRAAALQILRSSLSLPSPERYAKPSGDVVVLTGSAILAALIRRETEAADGRTLRRVAQFGVAAEVSDQDNLVERHDLLRFCLSRLTGDLGLL